MKDFDAAPDARQRQRVKSMKLPSGAAVLSILGLVFPLAREVLLFFDKLTAGKRDGFLIDCWPGLSLRVIVGPHQEEFPDVPQAEIWQHIAVVLRRGRLEAYLNGNKL